MIETALRSKLTISLDENLLALKESLKAQGFKVIVFKPGSLDSELYHHQMQGTAVLTQNSKDFLVDAVIHDFDVVAVEHIKFIDSNLTRNNTTTTKIANAIRDSQFYNQRGNFLVTVFDDGKYTTRRLM